MKTELFLELSEFFQPEEVFWKAQAVSGNRALAIAYIDARSVMERLDAVVGPQNWQDRYEVLPDGSAVCTLSVRVDGEWISKSDVGGESDQKDVGDKRKASFSDALKRAAVKFGIGRYLYRLEGVWVDYDAQHKRLVKDPTLPDWCKPKPRAKKPALVNAADAQELADLFTLAGGDPVRTCDHFKVKKLSELTHDQAVSVRRRLIQAALAAREAATATPTAEG